MFLFNNIMYLFQKNSQVIIGEGGTGLIFQIFYSLIKPGDEVIIFQPFFQYFYFNSKMAGATLRFYELETLESKWVIDFDRLEALFNEKTKLIIINSPHNPTGKVFTSDELLSIRKILKKFPDVIVLSDEVYEKCVYDDMKYCRMGEFEDMWDRTITILSSGKVKNLKIY